jgi:Leucine-rich repeat (LRR) protein
LWPTFKYCALRNKDFPATVKLEKFSFSGSIENKIDTTAVFLFKSLTIDFIPSEILNEFPNLNGFLISGSNIPTLKEKFFTKQFKIIENLYLYDNKIKQIKKEALINLPELRWIYLSFNQIKSIKRNIFKNNQKLEFIELRSNEIKMIHPKLFVNLLHLIEVWLDVNDCVNLRFGGPSASALPSMNGFLKNCFDNCLNDDECASNKTITTTKATKTTTEITQLKDVSISQFEFEEFENQTVSIFDALNDFCRIEINKTAEDLDSLKKQVDVCLTKDEKVNITNDFDSKLKKRDENLSGLNQKVTELKNKFDSAFEASKCQQENIALKEKNAALEKKLEKQQEVLEEKYKKDLAKEIEDKLSNYFEKKLNDEIKKHFDNKI